jgi:capsular exopolysaccharide synthesis family protein
MSHVFEAPCWSGKSDPMRDEQASLVTDSVQTIVTDALDFERISSLRPQVCPDSRLIALTDGSSLGSEKFRLLSTRLRYLQQQRGVKQVVITSAAAEEGKTLVAANLAITLARRTKQKILLLEGDFRRPVLAGQLGLSGLPGLVDWMEGDEPVSKFVYKLEAFQLWFLPAGTTSDPLEILHSPRLAALLSRLVAWFDWILIDCPPLLPLADANRWAQLADGILLVVRQGKTSKKLLQKGLEMLDSPTLLGLVVNDATRPESRHYQPYYGAPNSAHQRDKTRTSS